MDVGKLRTRMSLLGRHTNMKTSACEKPWSRHQPHLDVSVEKHHVLVVVVLVGPLQQQQVVGSVRGAARDSEQLLQPSTAGAPRR